MRIGEYPPQTVAVTDSVPAAAARLPLTSVAEPVELIQELPAEMAMLAELGVGKPNLERAAQNAIANGTSISLSRPEALARHRSAFPHSSGRLAGRVRAQVRPLLLA
jgi:hypothetical protein